MKPTKRQVLRKSLSISLAAFTFVALLTSTFAWFKGGIDISFSGIGSSANVVGGIEKQYFGGDSSNPNWGHDVNYPYLIQNKEHLYNLAWLQYLGYFNTQLDGNNRPSSTPNIQQLYFELDVQGGVLDMEGMVLPPIGTETYPFYSHFNGNNQTIKNLIVSNDDPNNTNSDFGVLKPQSINTNYPNAHQPRVVGFFGAVGYISTCDAPNINAQTCSSYVASIEGLTLQDITIQNGTNLASGVDNSLLIGLVAGYVGECNMSGVKVSGTKSALKINGNKTAIGSSITQKLSDYGLVGYSKKTGKIGTFVQELSKYYDSNDPEHGGDNWGGSVDMRLYNKWIYNQWREDTTLNRETFTLNANTWGSPTGQNTANYNLKIRALPNVTRPYGEQAYSGKVYYDYYANPEDFDEPSGFYVRNTVKYVQYEMAEDTYLPLKFNETDELNWGTVADNNTGYIAGYYENYASPVFNSNRMGLIGNSLQNTKLTYSSAYSNTTVSFSDSNLELLTYSTTDGNWRMISDTYNQNHSTTNSTFYNSSTKKYIYDKKSATDEIAQGGLGLKKYTDSRAKLSTTLSNPRIHALRFQSQEVSSSKYVTIPSAKIQNATYSNYKVPAGAIDFSLKEDGYINFFAGSYYAGTNVHFTFFSIYVVVRSGSNYSVKRIMRVYQNTNTSTKDEYPYVYEYSDSTYGTGSTSVSYTKGSLLFDLENSLETTVDRATMNNILFYFEIPANKGEYAMGMVPGKNSSLVKGAGLIYLDIGSNGANLEKKRMSAYRIATTDSGNAFPTGVDFATVGTNTNKDGGQSFCLSIPSSQTGSMTFNVSTNTVEITTSITGKYSYKSSRYVVSSPNSNQFTVTGISYSDEFIVQTEKTQVTYFCAPDSGGTKHLILITEVLQPTQSTTYTLDGASKTKAQLQTAIPLLTDDAISTINTAVSNNAFVVARDNTETIATFDCVLPKTVSGNNKDFPWANGDIYNVTIDPYASGLKLSITRVVTTCSMKINGNNITFTNNAASYPAS